MSLAADRLTLLDEAAARERGLRGDLADLKKAYEALAAQRLNELEQLNAALSMAAHKIDELTEVPFDARHPWPSLALPACVRAQATGERMLRAVRRVFLLPSCARTCSEPPPKVPKVTVPRIAACLSCLGA